jgi:hypothetical protein
VPIIKRVIVGPGNPDSKIPDRQVTVEIEGCGHRFELALPVMGLHPLAGDKIGFCIGCHLQPTDQQSRPSGRVAAKVVGAPAPSKRRAAEWTRDKKERE